MKRLTLTVALSFALVVGSLSGQQAGSASPAVPARIDVHAPFAQQLIAKIKAEHPEIQKLGLRAIPPGQTQSAIVANNFPEKIGKLSAPSDLQTVASGEPKAHRIERGKFWDTFVPLQDENGLMQLNALRRIGHVRVGSCCVRRYLARFGIRAGPR